MNTSKLENVAIAHCSCTVQPPGSSSRLKLRRHAKYEVAEHQLPYYSVFAADTLLYAVTLTSDLEHLQ